MDKYLDFLYEAGVYRAEKIDAAGIITGAWTDYKCRYGCDFYGKRRCCPPYTHSWKETQEIIDCYKYGILFNVRECAGGVRESVDGACEGTGGVCESVDGACEGARGVRENESSVRGVAASEVAVGECGTEAGVGGGQDFGIIDRSSDGGRVGIGGVSGGSSSAVGKVCTPGDSVNVTELAVELSRRAFLDGYYKSIAFGSGPCLICKECDLEHCRFPKKAVPSMEGCGIDVFATARLNGFEIDTVKDKEDVHNYFGLVLFE